MDTQDRREGDSAIYQTLGRIEGTLAAVQADVQETKEYVRDVSRRVRSLEIARGWLIGAGGVAGAVASWLMSLFR